MKGGCSCGADFTAKGFVTGILVAQWREDHVCTKRNQGPTNAPTSEQGEKVEGP